MIVQKRGAVDNGMNKGCEQNYGKKYICNVYRLKEVDRKRRKRVDDIRRGGRRELIDTLWNVKVEYTWHEIFPDVELIDTLWNVKLNPSLIPAHRWH